VTDRKNFITLGGNEFEIKPLDLGTLKEIGIGAAKMQVVDIKDPRGEVINKESNWYDGTFGVIAAATKMSVEDVLKIEGATLQELLAANRAIFLLTGLVTETAKPKKSGLGEESGASAG
jgi:hypothetical protein